MIYSAHGVCRIDDICEKKFDGAAIKYYELHPVEDDKLTISVPVGSEKVAMLSLLSRSEAEEILESFRFSGAEWIQNHNRRTQA